MTVVTDPINAANESQVTVSGTGQVGATVTVVASDGTNSTTTYTATVASDGTWSVSNVDVSALADGTITITATASDGTSSSAQSSKTTTKDATAPSVTIGSVTSSIDASNASSTTASGTGEGGATITLVVGDGTNTTTSYTATVASDGTWSISGIDVSALADGTLTYTATAEDAAGNTSQATRTATKSTVSNGSLSGIVYVDLNGSGAQDANEPGLAGVMLTLSGVDTQGNPLPSQTTVTASDGSYSFSNLAPGTYSITKLQPAKLTSGSSTAGTLGGTAATNSITGIALSSGGDGTSYNFYESGLDPSMISIRLFLASTPPADKLFSDLVTQFGVMAPAVKSMSKNDADPTTATTVNYTVTFNESVTGVDTSSFTILGGSGASITSVTGSGDTYVVAVNVGSSTGSIMLKLVDNDTIASTSGTPLGGTGTGNGDFVGPAYTLGSSSVTVTLGSVTDPVNAENESNVTASGTADAGDTISLVVSDGTNSTQAYTTTADSSGAWSITGIDTSALADGTLTFTVTASNTAGNTNQATLTATKDTVAPAVGVSSVTDPINAANAASVSASGTGEAGATISLVVDDGTTTSQTYNATIGTDGTWSITGIDTSGLADGTLTFTATASDAAGNTATASQTATKDTTAPAVDLAQVTDPITIANYQSAAASGTGEVGATITLVVTDGTTSSASYSATVGSDGTWSITGIDTSGLVDGTLTFTATASDTAGNTSQSSRTATKTTIAVSSVTDPINAENATSVTIGGTGEAGATVSVVATDGSNTTTAYTTTIAEDGTWSISGIDTSALADGTITFTATATDGNENSAVATRSATKDTVAPEGAISGVTDPINLDNAAAVTANGTGEVGATVTLVVTDGTDTTSQYQATIGTDGTWSITGIDVSALADGTLTFNATIADAAGNTATVSTTANKDTVAPAVEVNQVADPVTIANHKSLDVGGTGEAGATISLVVTDGTHSTTAYQTTVGEDGTWAISGVDTSGLTDGEITFQVTATDAAGNAATSSVTSNKVTVAIGAIGGINADNDTDFTVSGTGEIGATITLVVSDGTNSTSEYQATVGEDGTWTITGIDLSGLADGSLTFSATATDGEQNTADTTALATKDTVAPEIVLATVTDPINAANADNVSASGTGEAGATVTLVVTDTTHTTQAYATTIDEAGNWSITGIDTSALDDGTLTFQVTATDAAGNAADTSLTATKDTVPPNVALTSVTTLITLDNQDSTQVSGTGDAGDLIQVVASDGTNSTDVYTATVAEDGTWSIDGIDVTALADGTVTYTATATDTAGNIAEDTLTTTKQTVAITSVTDPISSLNSTSVTVSGTSQAGAFITLVAGDGTNTTDQYTTTADSNGDWSIDGVDTSSLADGTITFTVTADDGNQHMAQATATALKDTLLPAVSADTATDPINAANQAAVQISGTGEVGASIQVVAGDGTTSTIEYGTTVGAGGTWSIEGIDASALADGTITFTVTATDAASNQTVAELTVTKDTVVTGAITSVTDPIDADHASAVTANGTGEVGASVALVVSDGTNSTTTYTATVDSDGNWALTNIDVSSLADGTLTFSITVTDAAGNTIDDSLTASKDTSGSATPLVDLALAEEDYWL